MAKFLNDILTCGKIYSQFLLTDATVDKKDELYKALQELSRIQGAPAYLLLLYLMKNQNELTLKKSTLVDLVKFLTKFFVRRNLTDVPNTRDLTNIFMYIIDDIQIKNLKGVELVEYIQQRLIEKSATDEIFMEKLDGRIYEENTGVARFVLCSLAEKYMTNEKFTDLWAQNDYSGKKVYAWTIEHIFPEGNNIPDCWVEMIASGDKKLAKQYLEEYVHKLGNLTITAYNSTLSNKSFVEKRDRKNQEGKFVGYKNGLQLNEYIKSLDSWTIENIKERTKLLKSEIIDMFKFNQ